MSKKSRYYNYRVNFPSPLHLACGNDELRPAMMCVSFDNNYVVATDAHIVIRQSFELFDSRLENLHFLNGKFLHRKAYARIFKEKTIEIQETGILASDSDGNHYFYPYSNGPQPENFLGTNVIYPKTSIIFDQAIERCKKGSLEYNEFGINANILHKLNQVMFFDGNPGSMKFRLPRPIPTQAILIEAYAVPAELQLALIMPVMVIS